MESKSCFHFCGIPYMKGLLRRWLPPSLYQAMINSSSRISLADASPKETSTRPQFPQIHSALSAHLGLSLASCPEQPLPRLTPSSLLERTGSCHCHRPRASFARCRLRRDCPPVLRLGKTHRDPGCSNSPLTRWGSVASAPRAYSHR